MGLVGLMQMENYLSQCNAGSYTNDPNKSHVNFPQASSSRSSGNVSSSMAGILPSIIQHTAGGQHGQLGQHTAGGQVGQHTASGQDGVETVTTAVVTTSSAQSSASMSMAPSKQYDMPE